MRKLLFLSLEMMVLALVMYAGGRGASGGKRSAQQAVKDFQDYAFSSKAPRSGYSKAFQAPSTGSSKASKTSGKGKG